MSVLLAAADRIGAALVVATHDPAVADLLSTRWQMRDGSLDTINATPLQESRVIS